MDQIGPIPVQLNLSGYPNPDEVIGWATAARQENGCTQIVIDLDAEASVKLDNLASVFELKALGFAGIRRTES